MSIDAPSRVEEKLRVAAEEALAAERPETRSDPALARLSALGTELWLDTGNLDEARGLWTGEFSALTTNNTLANQVVQTGVMDDIAREALRDLRESNPEYDSVDLVRELGFIVNAHIALRLVKAFGVKVSVELHPGVSDNIEQTVAFAERYYRICPEKFIIKIPLTPEGYCAVAQVRAKGIPVNYTLGFSARQNYLAALLSNPSYCNVFLGRLNAVVSDNRLGDGKLVGEKVTLATQAALRELRDAGRSETKLIAASMRDPGQARDLAGVDVYTIPPKVAKQFMEAGIGEGLEARLDQEFEVAFNEGVDTQKLGVLWEVDDAFRAFADELASRGGENLTGDDLREADSEHGTGLFHRYTSIQVVDIKDAGKIPNLDRWQYEKDVALDDLMTQSALQSFAVDQEALDSRLEDIVRQS
jgi:transaldolase